MHHKQLDHEMFNAKRYKIVMLVCKSSDVGLIVLRRIQGPSTIVPVLDATWWEFLGVHNKTMENKCDVRPIIALSPIAKQKKPHPRSATMSPLHFTDGFRSHGDLTPPCRRWISPKKMLFVSVLNLRCSIMERKGAGMDDAGFDQGPRRTRRNSSPKDLACPATTQLWACT